MGNQKDPAALADLAWSMENEPESLVRAHVAWAIGEIGGSIAGSMLDRASKREADPLVSGEIIIAQQQIASHGSHSGSPAS